MTDFPYLTKTSAIKDFLEKIHETGVPAKIDQTYLPTIGFTSSNDRPLIPLFKFLGFLDKTGKPTELYQKYRAKKDASKILAKAIKDAYSGLFTTYPDASKRDVEALSDYFRTTTGKGTAVVKAVVSTFKALCENADFSTHGEIVEEEKVEEVVTKKKTGRTSISIGESPTITINIQLQLPVTESDTFYDKLFASLRKNLLVPVEEEK